MNYGGRFRYCTGHREQDHPQEKEMQKSKITFGSEEALQIPVKRREAKSKGEKERYNHLNAEFQRRQEEITKPSSGINAKK